MRLILLALSFGIAFGFGPVTKAQGTGGTVDFYLERMNRGLAEGGEYKAFRAVLDPSGMLEEGLSQYIEALQEGTDGSPLRYVEMFRVQNRPNGARTIGAITNDKKIVAYMALTLLRIDGEWLTVWVAMSDKYGELVGFQ